MSSDADYAAFLDKANQDTGSASTQTTKLGTKTVDTEVPAALKSIDEVYTSDADEPFEPVSLKWGKDSLPNADDFAKLIDHKHKAEQIGVKDWDPKGQYTKVVDAVKKAGSGDVAVFTAEHGGTRTEYWVVSLDNKNGRVVGLKALSVES